MEFKISIESESKRFHTYLSDEDNQRIIFSGIFGIGKTYFLKEFFFANQEGYFPIHLSPVNYSISSTEDIFKIIKYDILYEIFMSHNTDIITEKVDKSIAVGMAIQEANLVNIAQHIFKWFLLLNKESDTEDINNVINLSADIYEKAKSKQGPLSTLWKLAGDSNRNEEAVAFIKSIMNQFHLEEDFITEYIEEKIKYKATNNKLKSILIIDDLDRIDPEHIFRLFNIFSSHINYRNEQRNKFGFDKIIFVCDINNIKNIFQAKYGIQTDFNGYIDKFFSKDIYYFANNKNVSSSTYEILQSIYFKPQYDSRAFDELIKESPLYTIERDNGILSSILLQLNRNGLISMRRISSIYGKTFHIEKKIFSISHRRPILNTDLLALVALEILTWIAGDVDNLEKALEKNISIRRVEDEKQLESGSSSGINIYLSQYFLPILYYSKANLPVDYTFQGITPPTNSYELEMSNHTKCRIDFSINRYKGLMEKRNYTDPVGHFYRINNNNDMPRHFFDEVLYQSFKIMKDYLKDEARQSYFT